LNQQEKIKFINKNYNKIEQYKVNFHRNAPSIQTDQKGMKYINDKNGKKQFLIQNEKNEYCIQDEDGYFYFI